MLSNKSYRKRKRKGDIHGYDMSSQVIAMHDEALLSWKWLSTCSLMGSGE